MWLLAIQNPDGVKQNTYCNPLGSDCRHCLCTHTLESSKPYRFLAKAMHENRTVKKR